MADGKAEVDNEKDRLSKTEEKETTGSSVLVNNFVNDGSFMELFKKRMEQKAIETRNTKSVISPGPSEPNSHSSECNDIDSVTENEKTEAIAKKTTLPFVGKRRGGKVLKTGIVKKLKKDESDNADNNKDAWSRYMAEVNEYKQKSCIDEDKTRPLVK
ncbi:C19orf43 (predicted) [Pycnogonum litorale]